MTTNSGLRRTTDVVVVLPGIMGSVLGQKTKTQEARENLVWAPSAGAAIDAIHNFIGKAPALALPAGIGDNGPEDGVEPVALMPDIHVVAGLWTPKRGYDRLLAALERLGYHAQPSTRPPNLIPVPYDWRLSNRYNGERLRGIVEPALDRWRAQGGQYADAQLVFICHSMGGLVARWYLEKCGGAELTRKLITLGTPWRGAGMAVEKLSNGVPIKIGPFAKLRLDTFARSLPGLYQLLPEYACIRQGHDYVKTTEAPIPGLEESRVADALAFYTDLQRAERNRPGSKTSTHMLVGTRQPTITTFEIAHDKAVPSQTFGTDNEYGDGTVPATGAVGHDEPLNSNLLHDVVDQHGNLQWNSTLLDSIERIITASDKRRKYDPPYKMRVTVPDLVTPDEGLDVSVEFDGDYQAAITIEVRDEKGVLRARQPRVLDRKANAHFADLAPGAYTVEVGNLQAGGPVSPIVATSLVWTPHT